MGICTEGTFVKIWHSARRNDSYRYMALTMIPIILPNVAPIAIEGTKIPAGTLHPYEITTKPVRITVARNNEFTIGHCTEVLRRMEFNVR